MPSLEDFDVSVFFDENLREVPNNPHEMALALKHLITEFERLEPKGEERIKQLGQIGSYARILKQFEIAEAAINEALNLCKSNGDAPREVVNLIRLAHIYQWQGQYSESNRLFSLLLERTRSELEAFYLEDFVLQHTGKNYFEQQRYAEALELFERALEIRVAKGDESLIESTEVAIA